MVFYTKNFMKMNLENITNRIAWIDLIETIAIFFVILYHGFLLPADILSANSSKIVYLSYFMKTILSTCVPLFFFANGYLLFSRELNLKKHIRMIIKYILLAVIWGIITLLFLLYIKHEIMSPSEFINALLSWKQGYINHLWFLGALVCIYILYPLMKVAYDYNIKIFVYFIIICAVLTFGNDIINYAKSIVYYFCFDDIHPYDYNNFNIFNPLRGNYGYSFVYFCLGGAIHMYFKKIMSVKKHVRNLISIVGLILNCFGLFLIGVFYTKSLGTEWDVVWNGYSSCFTLMNVLFIFNLTLNYKKNYIITYIISSHTLGIYLIHMLIIRLLNMGVLELSFKNVFVQFIYILFIIIVSALITLILKKIPLIKKLV